MPLTWNKKNSLPLAVLIAVLLLLTACDGFQELSVTNNTAKTIHVLHGTYMEEPDLPPLGTRYRNSHWDISDLKPGETKSFLAWSEYDDEAHLRSQLFLVIDPETQRSINVIYMSFDELRDNKWNAAID